MPFIRRRRRSYVRRPIKAIKYSNETYVGAASFSNDGNLTQVISFVPPIQSLGVRKCKNFALSIMSQVTAPVLFALVFVPEGTNPSGLSYGNQVSQAGSLTTLSMYEPNQNVIMSGIFGGTNTNVERFKTRLSRNLNAGDQILLVWRPLETITEGQICAALNFAIAY